MRLPFLFTAELGAGQVAELARALGKAVDGLDASSLTAAPRQAASKDGGVAVGEPRQ